MNLDELLALLGLNYVAGVGPDAGSKPDDAASEEPAFDPELLDTTDGISTIFENSMKVPQIHIEAFVEKALQFLQGDDTVVSSHEKLKTTFKNNPCLIKPELVEHYLRNIPDCNNMEPDEFRMLFLEADTDVLKSGFENTFFELLSEHSIVMQYLFHFALEIPAEFTGQFKEAFKKWFQDEKQAVKVEAEDFIRTFEKQQQTD